MDKRSYHAVGCFAACHHQLAQRLVSPIFARQSAHGPSRTRRRAPGLLSSGASARTLYHGVSPWARKSRKSDSSTAWPMSAVQTGMLLAQRCSRMAMRRRPVDSSAKTIPTPFRVSRHRRGSAVGPTIERSTRPAKGAADPTDRQREHGATLSPEVCHDDRAVRFSSVARGSWHLWRGCSPATRVPATFSYRPASDLCKAGRVFFFARQLPSRQSGWRANQ